MYYNELLRFDSNFYSCIFLCFFLILIALCSSRKDFFLKNEKKYNNLRANGFTLSVYGDIDTQTFFYALSYKKFPVFCSSEFAQCSWWVKRIRHRHFPRLLQARVLMTTVLNSEMH